MNLRLRLTGSLSSFDVGELNAVRLDGFPIDTRLIARNINTKRRSALVKDRSRSCETRESGRKNSKGKSPHSAKCLLMVEPSELYLYFRLGVGDYCPRTDPYG